MPLCATNVADRGGEQRGVSSEDRAMRYKLEAPASDLVAHTNFQSRSTQFIGVGDASYSLAIHLASFVPRVPRPFRV